MTGPVDIGGRLTRIVRRMTAAMDAPKAKVEDCGGSLSVWLVDGSLVRRDVDGEFTNFGQHYRFPFIPEGELWIDREAAPDEYDFFVIHLLEERRLMAEGMGYGDALTRADAVERKARRAMNDLAKVVDAHGRVDPARVHKRLWKRLEAGVAVWIVSGRLVRSALNIDFTQGGHPFVYEFVPDDEVWIDDDVFPVERPLVLLHELHERNRMAEGWPYSRAHEESSALEGRMRDRPDELHDALVAEGWA